MRLSFADMKIMRFAVPQCHGRALVPTIRKVGSLDSPTDPANFCVGLPSTAYLVDDYPSHGSRLKRVSLICKNWRMA